MHRVGVESVTVPRHKMRSILVAAGRDEAFIRRVCGSQRRLHMCVDHFTFSTTKTVTAKNVLPFADDPVMMGLLPGRGKAGDEWFSKYCSSLETRVSSNSSKRKSMSVDDERDAIIFQLRQENISHRRSIAKLKQANAILRATGNTDPSQLQASSDIAESTVTSTDTTTCLMFTYKWYKSCSDDTCNFYVGMTVSNLKYFVECNKVAMAEALYKNLVRGQPCKFTYEDAICIGITRLFRMRQWKFFESMLGIPANTIRLNAKRAFLVTQCVVNATINRIQDKCVRERFRVSCLTGEFGHKHPPGKGPVEAILDGFSVRVDYPSPPSMHRKVHSQYMYDSVCQATVCLNSAFEFQSITNFYCGSDSETKYVIDDGILEADNLLEKGDAVMTDKGYRLGDYLREKFGCIQIKPTEVTKGKISTEESARSRRVSQPRASSERAVFWLKRWDIFNGRPVQMKYC